MHWSQSADWLALEAVAAFHGSSPGSTLLTRAAQLLLTANLVKMGLPVSLLLYTWLRRGSLAAGCGVLAAPGLVARGALGIAVALAAGRLLQNLLPMRPRPRFVQPDPFPPLLDHAVLGDWSSLPSDHAVLAAAVATATWAASRPLALLSMAWGALFVCLPRVYFGLHYVSDILAGAALGVALTAFVLRMPMPATAWGWLRRLDARKPALVILGLFVLGWEMVELFGTARRLASAFGKAARIVGGGLG